MRRWAKIVILGSVAIGLAGLGFVRFYFGSAEELEKWIGRQCVAIVNTFIVPQLSFAELDYQTPAAVSMKQVALTSPDGTKVLEVAGFDLVLAETPGIGKPIVVETVAIDGGQINLIRDGETGGFRGLSPFVKSADLATPIQTEAASASSEPFRLSDVLRLRLIDLNDIGFRYDAGHGQPPMVIDGITAQLTLDPGGEASEPGWYELDFTLDRGPNLHLGLRGRLNLDTAEAELDECRFSAGVGPDSLDKLPPAVQELVRRYDARGRLDIRVSGHVDLTDFLASTVSMQIELKDFQFVMGPRRLSVESLALDAEMAERVVELTSLSGRVLKGEIAAHGGVDLSNPDLPATLNWRITDVDLADWRTDQGDAQQPLRGLVSSTGTAQAAMARFPASLAGSGEVHVREGRLANLPLVSTLADLMKIVIPAAMAPADTADAEFRFTPDGVRVERLEFVTALLAARGDGIIHYDGTLNARLNAGPLEKVQSLLGKAGDLLGHLTDKLVAYEVTGRLGNPRVRVKVLDHKLGE